MNLLYKGDFLKKCEKEGKYTWAVKSHYNTAIKLKPRVKDNMQKSTHQMPSLICMKA